MTKEGDSPLNRFEGQSAIVTGGASGIGAQIAERLAHEGADVTIWDIHTASPDSERVTSETVDLTSPEAVYAARDAVLKRTGRIDILVCSAGITGPNATVADYDEDDWRKVFDINVHGLFYCNKAVVAPMTAAGYGRIVNIASIAGKEGNPNASAYSASKAAVIGLTKSLGKELASTGVTVNTITPAAVRTAMFSQMSDEHIAYMLSKIPMGRFGQIEEVASLVAWLASSECAFSTGAVFDISGGRAVY
ncbi:MAG: SDR family NAD(P)-dependent oxidoreductase [Pseudomonadota bacterium]